MNIDTNFIYKTRITQMFCDFTNTLSHYGLVCLVNDATMYFNESRLPGVMPDFELNGQNYIWIVAKVKYEIYRRPARGEEVSVKLIAEKFDDRRGYRGVEILTPDGKLAARGRICMALLNKSKGAVENLSDFYRLNKFEYVGTEHCLEYSDIRRVFEEYGESESFNTYKALSLDINFDGHMDNAWFLRMGLSMFSVEELKKMKISSFELHYISSCFEGEIIDFYRSDKEGAVYLKACVGDKTCALYKFSLS